jgi:3',5'-cyclic AMP phosphodiesterase CpdA
MERKFLRKGHSMNRKAVRHTSAFVFLIPAFLAVLILNGCSSDSTVFPEVRFCVFSDPHYFDPDLGTSGSAFADYIENDRKLLAESEEIFRSLVRSILQEDVEFVLVPGDLTKDGELSGHKKVSEFLRQIENTGKKVYVIPGNHDISNPHAFSFSGDSTEPVPSVTAETFAEIYRDFGYDEALERDPNSLSYVVEPKSGLWILAMDSCRYRENTDSPVTGGRLSGNTLNWVTKKLDQARSKDIVVIGMMHHGIVEHFTGQAMMFPEYVLEDWTTVSEEFADFGMQIVLTGHFHAQDIVERTTDKGNTVIDIETGSLVTYPCPYRVVQLDSDGQLTVSSRRITNINYDTGGKPFQDYARDFIENGMDDKMASMLIDEFQISQEDALQIAPYMAAGMVAHFAGDETPSDQTSAFIEQLITENDMTTKLIGLGLQAIWNDPEPADNSVSLDLSQR